MGRSGSIDKDIKDIYGFLRKYKRDDKEKLDDVYTYTRKTVKMVLCQDNGHIKPLFFGKISKMHNVVAFIPRFA